ncbi:MAG: DUF188 domain-containing protein [Bacillota bacterium]|nr:DUF188 domain-containing protein [Bacillota bacterium]
MSDELNQAGQQTQSANRRKQPTVRVDADACPVSVRHTIERITRIRHISLVYYIDENHELYPNYGHVEQVGQGHDAVDMALINQVVSGDLVVTQDYGLAALVLARRAEAIHPSGRIFSDENIDRLLLERHLSAKARRAGQRTINPRRRKTADDKSFESQFRLILDRWPERAVNQPPVKEE